MKSDPFCLTFVDLFIDRFIYSFLHILIYLFIHFSPYSFVYFLILTFYLSLIFQVKSSRAFFNEVNKRFPTLPFSLRSLPDEKAAKMGMKECVNHNLLLQYPGNTEFLVYFILLSCFLVFYFIEFNFILFYCFLFYSFICFLFIIFHWYFLF